MPSSVFYVHLNQIAKSFYYHSQNFSSIYLPESLRDKEVLRCVFVISCWNYHNSLYSGLSVTSIIRGLQLVQTQVMCEDKQSLEYLIILLQQRGNCLPPGKLQMMFKPLFPTNMTGFWSRVKWSALTNCYFSSGKYQALKIFIFKGKFTS